jgi:outer membrane protein OmpA-like peptidoglycan-associated protein
MSPYLTVASGQNMFGEQVYNTITTNPSVNSLMVQGGVKLKLGVDEVRYDTLKYDPNYISPTQSFATAIDEKGLSVEGFLKKELVEISRIDLVEKGKIKEQVREEPVFAQEIARERNETPAITRADIQINKTKIYQYATSNTSDLSNEMKDYLTALAEYMKANPNTEARIVGHTDNVGTEDEKQKISISRATNARRFLMSKGIAANRILAGGEGDRKPIADARTPEGRRKNRRLEINLVNR